MQINYQAVIVMVDCSSVNYDTCLTLTTKMRAKSNLITIMKERNVELHTKFSVKSIIRK